MEQVKADLDLDKRRLSELSQLDGKFLVDTSNMSLDVAEVALGYKLLFETQSSRLRYSSQISKEAKDLFGKLSVKTSPKVLGVESIV